MRWRCSDSQMSTGWNANRRNKKPRSHYDSDQGCFTRRQKRQGELRQLKEQQPSSPPEEILVKKEAAAIGEFQSWDSCTVPLTVVANREHICRWSSRDLVFNRHSGCPGPMPKSAGVPPANLNRGAISSAQVFNDLTHFTSRAFSMVVNQVVFIMLAYNLLQLYLVSEAQGANQKTLPRIRQQLLPRITYVIVLTYQNYYGLFSPFELVGLAVTLAEDARKKGSQPNANGFGRELDGALNNPRASLTFRSDFPMPTTTDTIILSKRVASIATRSYSSLFP